MPLSAELTNPRPRRISTKIMATAAVRNSDPVEATAINPAIPRRKTPMKMRPKIRPMLKLPTICSPHVLLRSSVLLRIASMGLTPSVTRIGTAKKVAKFQARPKREVASLPRLPRSDNQRRISPTVAEMTAYPRIVPR